MLFVLSFLHLLQIFKPMIKSISEIEIIFPTLTSEGLSELLVLFLKSV